MPVLPALKSLGLGSDLGVLLDSEQVTKDTFEDTSGVSAPLQDTVWPIGLAASALESRIGLDPKSMKSFLQRKKNHNFLLS